MPRVQATYDPTVVPDPTTQPADEYGPAGALGLRKRAKKRKPKPAAINAASSSQTATEEYPGPEASPVAADRAAPQSAVQRGVPATSRTKTKNRRGLIGA
jgi:hypothetical protein